jgi:hypothetical protein
VVGDSTAQQFATGGAPAPLPGWHVTAQARLGCGVAQGNPWSDRSYIPAGDDCHQWPAEWQAAIAAVHPDVVILMVGAWEVLDHRVDGQVLRFGTPAWDQVVGGALDLAVAVASIGGTPVVALTVPCFDQASTPVIDTTDRNDRARVARTNALLATAVARVPGARLADYGGHVCPDGRYTDRLDGVELRPDGVHLGPDGAREVWSWLAPTLEAAAG